MADELLAAPGVFLKSIFGTLGIACVLISLAWITQAAWFDEPVATALWILLSAVVGGLGAGLLLAAHTDLARIAA